MAYKTDELQEKIRKGKPCTTVVKRLPPQDAATLFEAQWKAMLAPKEPKKRAKKAAAPEEEVAPEEAAAEEVTEVKTAAEAPAPEAENPAEEAESKTCDLAQICPAIWRKVKSVFSPDLSESV